MENRPIPTAPDFENLMTRGEMIAAAIYLPLHVLGVPIALNWLAGLVPAIAQMSNAELNILYYSVGLVYMLLLLRRFLRRSFDAALDAKGRFVLGIVGGYAVGPRAELHPQLAAAHASAWTSAIRRTTWPSPPSSPPTTAASPCSP